LKTTVSQPEVWKRVIEFEIPAEEVAQAVSAKLDEYRRTVRMDGFRPGKVPMAMVRQHYGPAAQADVVDEKIKEAFKAACQEHKIEPASPPEVTAMDELADDKPLRFTIETQVDPPVEIKGYDALGIKPKAVQLADADVDARFDSFIERFANFEEVARASKKGDSVRVEYASVTIDGTEREDLKNHSPAYPIELGAEGALKEFDEGLTGRKAGSDIDITVKFPEDYDDAGLVGKTGVFKVRVLAVLEKRLPEVNEEFLKKFGDFATADALKAEMRKGMLQEEEAKAKREAHNAAIDKLINDNQFEVPPYKIDTYIDLMIEDYTQSRKDQPVEPREELSKNFRPAATMALKRIRIIEYIAEKEKIKASQEEVDNEITQMAQRYGHDFDELKQMFRKNGTTNRIRAEIRERKTLDFLIGEISK